MLNGIVKFKIGFKCGCLYTESALRMVAEEETKEEAKEPAEKLCPAC